MRARCAAVTFDAATGAAAPVRRAHRGSPSERSAPSAIDGAAPQRADPPPSGRGTGADAGPGRYRRTRRRADAAPGAQPRRPPRGVCSTASPSRHPSASPDSARSRSCSYRCHLGRRGRSALVVALIIRPATFGAAPGQRPLHRARMHADPEAFARSARPARRAQRRLGFAGGTGERDHLLGELVRPPRPRPGRHQRGQPTGVDRGGRLIKRRAGEPERGRRRDSPAPRPPAPGAPSRT